MTQEGRQHIPNSLRKYRMALGLRQRQVAAIIGLADVGKISKWENGYCYPSARNVFKLSAVYSVMVEALYFDVIRALRSEVKARADKIFSEVEGVK